MPSSDRPHIVESAIDLPATAGSASSLLSCANRARPAKKRLKIWQIPAGWLCSIVGTRLTPADVERIVRRCGVTLPDAAQAYDVHGYLVGRAAEQGRVVREISKTLDEKHAAILRKVGAEPDQARLAALWNDLCSRGLVAGENQRLQAVLGVLIEAVPPGSAMTPAPGPIQTGAEQGALQLDGRCILYVGGRCQLLPHLRARAESCNACLLHHDGGQEESLQSLGRLVDRADVVLCPIDGVSHQAWLKVKALCRRGAKPFVPLRSSSVTCFARAVKALQNTPTLQQVAVAPTQARD